MRHGTSSRRQRGRGNGGGGRRGGPKRSQVFDSNGPDVRIRGTAHQVCEKYLTLAKDSSAAGDIVLAESYLQHAEHYQRIINSWNEEDSDNSDVRAKGSRQDNAGNSAQGSDDDLSLPNSILGESSNKNVQADQAALADA
ncbi:MAG: DUF4167 domain-containing protein [Alphaproteobacteria bacterium]|nr:DUF4167 domain-containing protein [Alphaproteobacteria bacterium]